MDLAFQFSTL